MGGVWLKFELRRRGSLYRRFRKARNSDCYVKLYGDSLQTNCMNPPRTSTLVILDVNQVLAKALLNQKIGLQSPKRVTLLRLHNFPPKTEIHFYFYAPRHRPFDLILHIP